MVSLSSMIHKIDKIDNNYVIASNLIVIVNKIDIYSSKIILHRVIKYCHIIIIFSFSLLFLSLYVCYRYFLNKWSLSSRNIPDLNAPVLVRQSPVRIALR